MWCNFGIFCSPQIFFISPKKGPQKTCFFFETGPKRRQQIGSANKGLPLPLVAGTARPNPKMGAPDPENPLFLGLMVSDHGLGRGQTMG